MKRRSLLIGTILAALPLPAWATPAPRWHSISKRRLGHSVVYQPPARPLLLPVTDDIPNYRHVGLKLTGGPLRLREVAYVYRIGRREVHRLDIDVRANTILPLPAPHRGPFALEVVSDIFADGHRYWHLVGTDDPL